jgi:hypothetical protein
MKNKNLKEANEIYKRLKMQKQKKADAALQAVKFKVGNVVEFVGGDFSNPAPGLYGDIYGFAGGRLTSKAKRGAYGTIFVEWENGKNTAHRYHNLKFVAEGWDNV